MNKLLILYIVLAAGLIVLGAVYGLPYLRRPDIDRLVQLALNADSKAEQVKAARELSQIDEGAVEGLRQLLTKSDNEDVVAISILGLSRHMDYQLMDQMLDKLGDSSVTVRSAAAKAAANLLGRDHHFPVNGTIKQRNQIQDQIFQDWKQYDGSELFEFNQKRFKE